MKVSALDWALCRSFLAILREGSLSGAARRLSVAHPTMSRHLEELEAALKLPLFVRSPTGLVPTEIAMALLPAAEAMEAAAENLVRTASADAAEPAGTVRITASEIIGTEVLPAMLARLKTAHPGLAFELAVSNDIANLARRDADIAVRMTRPTQTDLVARKLGTVTLGLFAHTHWLAAHGAPPSLPALIASGALIGYDRDPAMLRALAAGGLRVSRTDFGFRADSDLAQLAALRQGFGVGVCQKPLAARDPDLRPVLSGFSHDLELWLVSHTDLRGTRRVRVVLDALAEELAAYAREEER